MARFEIITLLEASQQVEGQDLDEVLDMLDFRDEIEAVLIDRKDNSIVYIDGGEPEDMLLHRNLSVFVKKLNEVADGN